MKSRNALLFDAHQPIAGSPSAPVAQDCEQDVGHDSEANSPSVIRAEDVVISTLSCSTPSKQRLPPLQTTPARLCVENSPSASTPASRLRPLAASLLASYPAALSPECCRAIVPKPHRDEAPSPFLGSRPLLRHPLAQEIERAVKCAPTDARREIALRLVTSLTSAQHCNASVAREERTAASMVAEEAVVAAASRWGTATARSFVGPASGDAGRVRDRQGHISEALSSRLRDQAPTCPPLSLVAIAGCIQDCLARTSAASM